MANVHERQTDLKSFEEARVAFTDAIDSAPEEALGYLKPGDDYALGGLVFHVSAVLEHYHAVLGSVLEAGFGPVSPADPPGLFETANARAKEGMLPEQRAGALEEVKRQHDAVAASLDSVGDADWLRKADVRYGPGQDPFPTSPADIAGWLIDHYLEHVPHVRQLLADWRAAP
jgi:hypothetical protein